MAREPILIGVDESPIILQVKGVDWFFNPDPPAEFLVKMMVIAKSLQNGEMGEFDTISTLLSEQLTEPDQRELWAKAEYGFGTIAAVLLAYVPEVGNLPTPPSSQSGKPHDGAGRKK